VRAGATKLLVDLGEAEDVTSAGMNALLAARQRLLERRGQVAVVLGDRLRRRFEVLQLGRRFLLASDRRHAARLLGLVPGGGRAGNAASRAHAA
jgi:anti-anti-sigma regulatory factor